MRFKHYYNVGLLWDFGWLHRRAQVSFCFIPFLLCREGDVSCVWKWLWREHWQMCHREKHTSSGERHQAHMPGEVLFTEPILIRFQMPTLKEKKIKIKQTWRPHVLCFLPSVTWLCHLSFEFLQGLLEILTSIHTSELHHISLCCTNLVHRLYISEQRITS